MSLVAEAKPYVAYGGAAKLFACRDRYVLFHGPRDTGKSRAACEYVVRYCLKYQGARVFLARKTHRSMAETILVTLESVLANLHPQALTGCRRENVASYKIGLSEIIPIGMDLESKQRSGECSILWLEEATEFTVEDYESLNGSVRWEDQKADDARRGWHQTLLTCNPDSDQHWIWQLKQEGKLTAIASQHKDNPSITKERIKQLQDQTGVRRKRFYEGLWVAAEGQVFSTWGEHNLIDVPELPNGNADYGALSISWYFAAIDWGMTDACALGIWGVDLDGNLIEVAEVYRTGMLPSWWVKTICEFHDEFALQAIVCDPSRPDMIAEFNLALGYANSEVPIAFGAMNKRGDSPRGDMGGISLVIDWLKARDGKPPRIRFVRDNLRYGVDETLRQTGRPTSTPSEAGSIVYAVNKTTGRRQEHVDPNCDDHGFDMTRYAACFARDKDLTPDPALAPDIPGSYGALYNHNKVVAMLEAEQAGIEVDWEDNEEDEM